MHTDDRSRTDDRANVKPRTRVITRFHGTRVHKPIRPGSIYLGSRENYVDQHDRTRFQVIQSRSTRNNKVKSEQK